MRLSLPDLVLCALVAALVLAVLPRRSVGVRASWTLTPGVLNPAVSQSAIGTTICRRGWTRTIRPPVSYTNDLKLEQMQQYGVTGEPADYQEDHLVSLELGG